MRAKNFLYRLFFGILILVCQTSLSWSQASPETSPAKLKQNTTLQWAPQKNATRYKIILSKSRTLEPPLANLETVETQIQTPALKPGQYYYQVKSFAHDGAELNTQISSPQTFSIGQSFTIISQKNMKSAAAPALISPQPMELFPTYGKVRIAWETIKEAKGYRFRLWPSSEEIQNKQEQLQKKNEKLKTKTSFEVKPRWVTTVPHAWIELRDAPYMSYMYLDSGVYKWDVAAIFTEKMDQNSPDNNLGQLTTGYFEISRQWFLREKETYFKLQYGISPSFILKRENNNQPQASNQSSEFKSLSHHFTLESDFWLSRHWGFHTGLGIRSLAIETQSIASRTVYAFNANLDLLYRKYLSLDPWGYTIGPIMGLEFIRYPLVQVQSNTNLLIQTPIGVGPRIGGFLSKRWISNLEFNARIFFYLQALLFSTPTENTKNQVTLNPELSSELLYYFKPNFAAGGKFSFDQKTLTFTPANELPDDSLKLINWEISIVMQWRFYSEEADKSNSSQWKRW